MAQWISQGGMQTFLVLFLSFFFFYGLMSFFESSEEISKNFPEISEDFKYFSKVKSTFIDLLFKENSKRISKRIQNILEIVKNLIWILINFSIFISATTTSSSAYSQFLANPIQKTSKNFGYVFNVNLIFISMLYDINMNLFRFWPFVNMICIKVAFLAFGINLMLWTFTHIVLYYKAKCAKTR